MDVTAIKYIALATGKKVFKREKMGIH